MVRIEQLISKVSDVSKADVSLDLLDALADPVSLYHQLPASHLRLIYIASRALSFFDEPPLVARAEFDPSAIKPFS
jgi:hypothetical protein